MKCCGTSAAGPAPSRSNCCSRPPPPTSHAVEADPTRAARARRNADSFGLGPPFHADRRPARPRVWLRCPAPMPSLSAAALRTLCWRRFGPLIPDGTRLVANAVTLETEGLLAHLGRQTRRQPAADRACRRPPLGQQTRLAAAAPDRAMECRDNERRGFRFSHRIPALASLQAALELAGGAVDALATRARPKLVRSGRPCPCHWPAVDCRDRAALSDPCPTRHGAGDGASTAPDRWPKPQRLPQRAQAARLIGPPPHVARRPGRRRP